MEELLQIESIIVVLVLVATLVAVLVRRIRLPYTVALVLVGLAISFRRPIDFTVTPELILSLFVPPLIFEAAFHVDLRMLRNSLSNIVVLAVPGVLLTTLLVGGIVSVGTGLPFRITVIFGALIAATDPVAVTALFRELGVTRQLSMAVEGESLFNDGTAIVVYRIALVSAISGVFNPMEGIFDFFQVALGGMLVGLLLGWFAAQLIARIDDRLISTTLSTLLAYGAYILAELFHVSGVLAVVVAGLMAGNIGAAKTSPSTKNMIFTLWEFLAFVANSVLFLLIGLEVDLIELRDDIWPIIVAVFAVLVSRAIAVYGLTWLTSTIRKKDPMKPSWRHVLYWGGLRGAISLALAISLPVSLAHRQTLLAMAFGVLLFTLMVQGTTIQFLLKKLGLTVRPEVVEEHERKVGRLLAGKGGLRRLEQLNQDGVLIDEMWEALRDDYILSQNQLSEDIKDMFAQHADLERELLLQAQREAMEAEQGALIDARLQGLITDEIFTELRADIDKRLEALTLLYNSIQSRRGS
ncbi:MAG: Na+/H+ antiporter [Anaerolineales bacterium]|nr:Na+/H+ antiporter [Anaerolineales bacterium]